MPEPTTDLTITIDGPHGYRSWTFTEQQLLGMTTVWREAVTEEVTTIVTTEIERMAN